METADVSVIIPTFNSASTIERAVASVMLQSKPVREVLVVDDASRDDTRNVVERLNRKFGAGCLRLIPLKVNGGAGEARNAGWNAAVGKYIAFLDADDTWHPRKIEIQYRYMLSRPELAVSGHEFSYEEIGEVDDAFDERNCWTTHFSKLLFFSYIVTPSLMIRRDVAVRFASGRRYMEDHLLLIEMAKVHGTIPRLPIPLCRLHKALYGTGGLSSHLVPMYLADASNYWVLQSKGYLGSFSATLLSLYATLKFVRRAVLLTLRGARRSEISAK